MKTKILKLLISKENNEAPTGQTKGKFFKTMRSVTLYLPQSWNILIAYQVIFLTDL